jgi:hypothetical protein
MIETYTQASLTAFGHPPCWVTAVVIEQTRSQRFGHALASLGMCWALALGGLFIPVAHFILVPTFVVAGIVLAIKRAREDRRLLLLRGACPRCGAAQEFKPGGRFATGRSIDCPKCHGTLTLVTGESAP